MAIFSYILAAPGAYLLGSIPFGFLVAKAKGIDIRSAGSGNIGATNALRVLGKPAGIFVMVMDVLKGFLAVYLAMHLAAKYGDSSGALLGDGLKQPLAQVFDLGIFAGIFAVLGHNYTCWLKFKGGKGIATTGGVYLALAPWALLVALIVFILAILLTKYVSVGSMAAAMALPVTVWVMTPHETFLGTVTTALGALAIYKHKGNLQRLRAGTENRLGQKKETK